MISGHGTVETAVNAIKLGAYDFIEKPFKTDRLLLVVDRALEAAKFRRENRHLKEETIPLQMIPHLQAFKPFARQLKKQLPLIVVF